MLINLIVCLVIGYFCGSISTGYLVGKAYHLDIRDLGSKNAGATNALRTLGIKGGLLTFLGDCFKIVIPITVLRFVFRDIVPFELFALYMGFGGVLGHNFPVWLHFRGGKGIAVTGGVILAIADWRITLGALLVFIVVVAVTKYVSVGSLIVVWAPVLHIALYFRDSMYFIHMLIIALLFMALAYFRHRENIKRLFNGTERKIGAKKNDE